MASNTARLALLTAVVGLAGCNIINPHACTLIGCQNGLRVNLARTPTMPFRVEVRSTPSAPTAYVYECSTERCIPDVFFPDYAGTQAFVTVITPAGTRTTAIERIEYRVSRPNGRDCPPECRQAMVTVDIP